MSILSLMEATLPPGFRFHPRDEELVCDYLAKKVAGNGHHNSSYDTSTPMMIEVDLNKIEPWDLPDTARVGGKDWYFYSLRDRKYSTGLRTNRATVSGYWKATGKDRQVKDGRKGTVVGMRKTLVFYQGRAPKGNKTDWVMHEFRLEVPSEPPKITFKEDWVLCRVFHKNRGVPSKQCQENPCDDTGSSSSLPPLSDPFFSFDQTPLNLDVFEQVPCFSNLTQSHTSPTFSPFPQTVPNMPTKGFDHQGSLHDLGNFLNPLSCEKKVIKAVLDHLTKLDGNQKIMEVAPISFSQAGSLESYFPELGLPSIWTHY